MQSLVLHIGFLLHMLVVCMEGGNVGVFGRLVVEADQCCADISSHGECDCEFGLVPLKVHAKEDGHIPINCDGVFIL